MEARVDAGGYFPLSGRLNSPSTISNEGRPGAFGTEWNHPEDRCMDHDGVEICRGRIGRAEEGWPASRLM